MVWKKSIFILVVSVLLAVNTKAENKDQLTKVALRAVGHEFLMQLNDSTSRVLPIEKLDNRYSIRFEREFAFEPHLLSYSIVKVFEKSQIKDNYIVEVEECKSKELVHSFRATLENNIDLLACRQRELPEACYTFYFTGIDKESELTSGEVKTDFNSKYLFGLVILLGLGLIFFFVNRKRKTRNDSDLINIGRYRFDQKTMMLTLKEESIQLSSKESDLLFLLFSNENNTLKREHILEVVWGDDGDYVGRTLDVFISKLRKKLEADPSLKIMNVRGVGYRFVVSG